jgi:hypothetical protein
MARHGGKRKGAGRKPDADAARLRRAARELCAARLEDLAKLAREAQSEHVKATAFIHLFRVAYGREMRDAVPDDNDGSGNNGVREKIEVEWATDAADAIPDPADR